jgi:6-pyruvoyl-tetrahydropterin synthase
MAYDFTDAKASLREITEELDHQNLNDLPPSASGRAAPRTRRATSSRS